MTAEQEPRRCPITPAPDDDPRFTLGLTLDVAELLARHGYPKPGPDDMVDLRQSLYRFLYRGGDAR